MSGPRLRASRASWRRSEVSASAAPGYCTLTATSRPSGQRPRCTWPIEAAAAGTGSSSTSCCFQSAPELALQDAAHRHRRHRRSGVLEPGQLVAVGRGQLVGQGRLEDRHRLAELHRAALELTQGAEELLGGALLDLGEHRLGGRAADPLAQAQRGATGVPQRQRRQPRRAGHGLARELAHRRARGVFTPPSCPSVRAIPANCTRSPGRAATRYGPDARARAPGARCWSGSSAARRRRGRAGRGRPGERQHDQGGLRDVLRAARCRPSRRRDVAGDHGHVVGVPEALVGVDAAQARGLAGHDERPHHRPRVDEAYDEMGSAVAHQRVELLAGELSRRPDQDDVGARRVGTTRVSPARASAAAVSNPRPAPRSSPRRHTRAARRRRARSCTSRTGVAQPAATSRPTVAATPGSSRSTGRPSPSRASTCSVAAVRGSDDPPVVVRPTWRWCGPRRTTRSPAASWRCMRGR